MEVPAIQRGVLLKYKYGISYGKALRTNQMALANRFVSFMCDAYDGVFCLPETLKDRNPGIYVDIQDLWIPKFPTVRVLH
jgi:hypothetical protein